MDVGCRSLEYAYLDFTASLTPVGDTDPALEDTIVWELVEYTEDSSGEESESSPKRRS